MIIDPDQGNLAEAEVLRIMFGLSAAEAELARAIAVGMTPKEYALMRSISYNTVRVQMQNVLEKTGSRRQSDVVQRITGIVAMLSH